VPIETRKAEGSAKPLHRWRLPACMPLPIHPAGGCRASGPRPRGMAPGIETCR
jgi:hypothetical protein